MAKDKITYYRHCDDDQWYRMSRVEKRREIETPWGPAVAEIGSFLMTLKGKPKHKIICTQDDLENHWTTDPVPDPPEPGEAVQHPPTDMSDPTKLPKLPGMDHGA
jgi:hypothetical protein